MASRLVLSGLLTAPLAGCVERTISITSEPPGALVYLNDEEVGRTPCEVHFLYYGEYDVRLVLDGHEPFMGSAMAPAPVYEWPGFDLVSELAPVTFRNHFNWHFDLEPVSADREQMIERARALRARMNDTLGTPDSTGSNGSPDAAGAGDPNGTRTDGATDVAPVADMPQQSPEDE